MTEPSTPDARRPSPRPRDTATTTSTPIQWPAEPIQVRINPVVELEQLRSFRAGIAGVLGTDSLDHDRIRGELDQQLAVHGATHLAVMAALDTIEHLPCVGDCPGRQVAEPERWCSFCTAKQVLADALAATGPAAVHVVHRDGDLLLAAVQLDAARQWAADAEQDGLTLTTLDVR